MSVPRYGLGLVKNCARTYRQMVMFCSAAVHIAAAVFKDLPWVIYINKMQNFCTIDPRPRERPRRADSVRSGSIKSRSVRYDYKREGGCGSTTAG